MGTLVTSQGVSGPVTVRVAAQGLPVLLRITGQNDRAGARVVTKNQSIDANNQGKILEVRVGSGAKNLLQRAFGGGSTVSNGSVRASGRGAIACGGNLIGNAVTGNGNVIAGSAEGPSSPGVYLDVPKGSKVDWIKNAASVVVEYPDGSRGDLNIAQETGAL